MRAVAAFGDADELDMIQETNMLSFDESRVKSLDSDVVMVSAHVPKDLYPSKVFTHLVIQGKTVRFQIDTGASCDILRVEELCDRTMLQPTKQRGCMMGLWWRRQDRFGWR